MGGSWNEVGICEFLNIDTLNVRSIVLYPYNPGSERKGVVQRKSPKHQMPHITAIPCITDSIGEDEASHDRHTKILSLEWKKSKPNKHAVSELMDSLLSTYPP